MVEIQGSMATSADIDSGQGGRRFPMRVLRALTLFVLIPIIIMMNACSLLMEEQRDVATSGSLTAKVILLNGGAMANYSGAVWVLPRYLPRVWPFDLLVGCRALIFQSDPAIDLTWEGSTLVIEHAPFAYPGTAQDRCYGRNLKLRERSA